jgi:autotransporter-associated beta strand protein
LDLTDGGVVNLLGANTFTGDTRIQNQGLGRVTLNLANVDALAGSTLDMNSLDTGLLYFTVAGNNTYNLGGLKGTRYITSLDGNSLSIGANDQSTTYSGIITATGGLTKVGNGTLTLSGNNSYTGTTAIDSGTLAISGGLAIVNTGTVSLANAAGVGLNVTASETIGSLQGGGATGGTVTIDAAQTLTVAETGSATFSGVITGAGGLTKTDAGTLTLSGNNDFTGATSISGGILNLSNVSALATTSGITLSGSSGLTFSGASDTFTRSVTVSPAETGFLRNSGGGVITLSGALSKNGSVLRFAEGSFTITGGITGSNADSDVYYESGGVISLNATNTYNGPTYILNGTTVNANVAGALPTDSLTALTINGPSSTLVLGAHQSIASLAGDADATVALGSYTLTVNGSTATAFAGTISGTGSLAKAGSGNLTLSAATTFTGATTIDSGKVVAATANALGGTSSITVNNGGSLLVTANGSVNDAATITLAGGAVSFSGNISETFGALTLSANSSLDLGTESVVAIFASIAGLNTYTLSIYNWTGNTLWSGHPGGGQDQVYIGSSLSPSDLQQISFYSGTDPNSFIANAWQLATYEVIAVPEPSSLLTAGLLVSLLGWMNKKPLARILRRKISSSPSLA